MVSYITQLSSGLDNTNECHERRCKENHASPRNINKFLCVTSNYWKRKNITYYLDDMYLKLSNSAGWHMGGGELKLNNVFSLYISLCSILHQKPKI
jgi:hypothetical protein